MRRKHRCQSGQKRLDQKTVRADVEAGGIRAQRRRREGERRRRGVSGGRSQCRTREVGSGDRSVVRGVERRVGGSVVVGGNKQDGIIKEGRSEGGKKDGVQMECGGGRDGRRGRRDGAGKKADGDRFEKRLP